MSVKVKRGLGLLVVALIAFLIAAVATQAEATPVVVVGLMSGFVMLGAGGAGLALLAWGLLRD